jgi:hypothetical protein
MDDVVRPATSRQNWCASIFRIVAGFFALLAGRGYLTMRIVESDGSYLHQRVAWLRPNVRWLVYAAATGPLLWTGAMLTLHILRPDDFERYGDTLSAYGVGPYGSLFAVAFVGFGLGGIVLAIGLRDALRRSGMARVGSMLVGLAGLGFTFVGLFPMAPDLESIEPAIRGDISPTSSAIIHGLGGLSGMLLLIVAMLLLSYTFRRDERWRSWWGVSLAFGLAALLLFAAGFFLPSPPVVPCCTVLKVAWAKAVIARVLFGILAAWKLLIALRLHAVSAEDADTQT